MTQDEVSMLQSGLHIACRQLRCFHHQLCEHQIPAIHKHIMQDGRILGMYQQAIALLQCQLLDIQRSKPTCLSILGCKM